MGVFVRDIFLDQVCTLNANSCSDVAGFSFKQPAPTPIVLQWVQSLFQQAAQSIPTDLRPSLLLICNVQALHRV